MRRTLVVLPALIRTGQAQISNDQVWQQFVDWLRTVPSSEHPATLIERYRAHLLETGVPAADANRRAAIVMDMLGKRPEGSGLLFDRIYASDKPAFSTRPNALLVAAVENRKPGRALDIGMGQGRNSVYLALLRWDVTGFDVSETGLEVARRAAAKAGVKINALRQDAEAFNYGAAQWDLIVITYEPVPMTVDGYVQRLHKSLRSGGLLVAESFASDAGAPVRRPVDFDPAELLRAFRSFRIRRFEDTEGIPDWADRPVPGAPAAQSPVTRLVRLVAEKN